MATAEPDLSHSMAFAAVCPLCGHAFSGRRWRVVDADHRPDLVTHAVDGSLQRSFCPACVGPGVEQAGAFCIVHRVAGRAQCLTFLAPVTTDFEGEANALQVDVQRRCADVGMSGDAIEAIGARWIQQTRDVEDCIAESWPELRIGVDPAMLNGPLVSLLNAAGPAERSASLLACPDLARPNVESFLGLLAEKQTSERKVAAHLARGFVAESRRIGVAAATRAAEATLSPAMRLRERAPELAARLHQFLSDEPQTANEFARMAASGRRLAAALMRADEAGLSAAIWCCIGERHRHRSGSATDAAIPKAIDAYQRALDLLSPDAADSRWQALMGLSACWDTRADGNRSDNLEHALACANAAREAARALPSDEQAEAAMEVGILYTKRLIGDERANLALAREALDAARTLASTSSVRLLAGYNLALTYVEDPLEGSSLNAGIGMLKLYAEPSVLEAFDTSQQQNLFRSLGSALARRGTGTAGGDLADLDEAAQFVRQALALAESRGDTFEASFLCGLLARIEADRVMRGRTDSNLADILLLLGQADAGLTRQSAPFEYARNEVRRAGILLDLADPELAAPMATQALQNACVVLTPDRAPDLCRRAQSELGGLRYRAGDYAAAAAAFGTACEASDKVFAATESVTGRADEVAPNAVLCAGLVDSLSHVASGLRKGARRAANWRVLEAMERGRARLTLDLMGLRTLPAFPGVPETLRQREAALLAELAWSVPGTTNDIRSVTRIDPERLRQQRHTRATLEALWDEIARCGDGGRRHAALRRSRPPTRNALAGLASTLGARTAIASFFVLPDRVLVVWLTANAPPVVDAVALSAVALREHWLTSFEGDVLAAEPVDRPHHAWLTLGETLFAPFADRLPDLDLLVLVPHRELHSLPLHALTVAGRPLIEQVPVVYAPSIGVLAAVIEAERADASQGVALVASHALDTSEVADFEGEANAVAELLGSRAEHHVRGSTVAASAPGADIIHLACHGSFDPLDPLASGLLLADGVMCARDWLPLVLHSDMITLSACETGRQQVRQGDELTGLARALLQAGSASVLLTLWRVYSDSTAEWMLRFYGALAGPDRVTRARAFQRATVELRAHDPDPRAWAAFVLIGDPG